MSYFAKYPTPRNVRRPKKMAFGKKAINSELMALKKSIANPFQVGVNPRIPDGKHILSNAMKSQAVKEFAFGPEEKYTANTVNALGYSDWPEYQAKDVLDILFFPGFNNMILVGSTAPTNPQLWHPANVGGTQAPDGIGSFNDGTPTSVHRQFRIHRPVPFDTHTGIQASVPVSQDSGDPISGGTNEFGTPYSVQHGLSNKLQWKEKNTTVQKWRLVTAGLRISCINNAQNNAGWFEAQRLNIPTDSSTLWALLPQPYGRDAGWHPADTNAFDNNDASYAAWYDNSYYTIMGRAYMDDATVPADDGAKGRGLALPLVPSGPMFDNPTYMSGKLRDMHKQMFRLKPSNDEHDYKELPSGDIGRANMTNNWPWNQVEGADFYRTLKNDDASKFVDDTFDCIHIRIHGNDGTRVLLHYVANQELVYQESALVTRLASKATAIADERQIAAAYNVIPPLAATTPPATPTRTTRTRVVTASTVPGRARSRVGNRPPPRRILGPFSYMKGGKVYMR